MDIKRIVELPKPPESDSQNQSTSDARTLSPQPNKLQDLIETGGANSAFKQAEIDAATEKVSNERDAAETQFATSTVSAVATFGAGAAGGAGAASSTDLFGLPTLADQEKMNQIRDLASQGMKSINGSESPNDLDELVSDNKATYDQAKEAFSAALKLITDHYDRESQTTQKITAKVLDQGSGGDNSEQDLAGRIARELQKAGVNVDPDKLSQITDAISKGGEGAMALAMSLVMSIADVSGTAASAVTAGAGAASSTEDPGGLISADQEKMDQFRDLASQGMQSINGSGSPNNLDELVSDNQATYDQAKEAFEQVLKQLNDHFDRATKAATQLDTTNDMAELKQQIDDLQQKINEMGKQIDRLRDQSEKINRVADKMNELTPKFLGLLGTDGGQGTATTTQQRQLPKADIIAIRQYLTQLLAEIEK